MGTALVVMMGAGVGMGGRVPGPPPSGHLGFPSPGSTGPEQLRPPWQPPGAPPWLLNL